MSLFGWMMPGDARDYPLSKLDDAIAWLEPDHDPDRHRQAAN